MDLQEQKERYKLKGAKTKHGLTSARALAKMFLDCTFSWCCLCKHAFPETNRGFLEWVSLEKSVQSLSAGRNCPDILRLAHHGGQHRICCSKLMTDSWCSRQLLTLLQTEEKVMPNTPNSLLENIDPTTEIWKDMVVKSLTVGLWRFLVHPRVLNQLSYLWVPRPAELLPNWVLDGICEGGGNWQRKREICAGCA